MPPLSTRAAALLDAPLRADFAYLEQIEGDPFDAQTNPDGAIPLAIAENVLSWPSVRARLSEAAEADIPDWVAQYAPVTGAPELRAALAGFAERHITTLGGREAAALDAECVCVSSGATGIVELSALLLGDDGDVAAFPAPCYPVYAKDVGHKAHLERHDIRCAAGWADVRGMHPLTVADLDRSRGEIRDGGRRLRMLVLTQPDNPTGAIYSAGQLEAFADWCVRHEVHLCVNELYALSQIDPRDARLARDYPADPTPYTSFLQLIEVRRSPYLHWWYSVSKDFGLSGLRCGAMYTRNADLVQAFGNVGAPHTVSNHTQWLLSELLADEVWVGAFAKTNQARLTDAYASAVALLREAGVPYVPARGSLFVWARFNAGGGDDEAYWRRTFEERGVLLTAPDGFGHAEGGWLRVVYSCVGPEGLAAGLRRVVGTAD